ncbi:MULTISPECIES: 2-hydroxychromene-2-carboxylate isomerase [Thalassospira]|uniref:2-hydroxychromene-2-carboxylate isomerase n=2 Tax=Thalassospira TaxID=168934 RepID=A0A367W201_9PROT|nr:MULTISPECIES: 2-hydroxychromene-2-carboxylate isomerase [Thalassospira]MDG4721269.1 2-hydroxychromene-2-carboxylate isomerase [Thalassospira sp. FZY0004]RCK33630.1 DSBA oxidoreductase [Thalassospira profundimaris]
MSEPIIHYFFVQSPWSFFGFRRAVDITKKHNTTIIHKPCRAADVWEHGGGVPLAKRPKPRQDYRLVELKRWSEFLGIPINLHPKFFPVDEALAARTIIAAQEDGKDVSQLTETLMGDIWLRERDIADPAIVREALISCGLSPEYLENADLPETTATYDSNSQSARDHNIFGVPTYFIGNEMFWGQDRLDFVDRALG